MHVYENNHGGALSNGQRPSNLQYLCLASGLETARGNPLKLYGQRNSSRLSMRSARDEER